MCSKTLKLIALTLFFCTFSAYSIERQGRLGIGYTNQLANDIPAISFKVYQSDSFAFGGHFGISTDDDVGGYGAGVKIYSILFNEPRLNFFAAGSGSLVKSNASDSGNTFQFDFTLGSEFSFQGINSIGFSFEMGVSINNSDGFVVETMGSGLLKAAVHFYI